MPLAYPTSRNPVVIDLESEVAKVDHSLNWGGFSVTVRIKVWVRVEVRIGVGLLAFHNIFI